jgi:hypothetical protein
MVYYVQANQNLSQVNFITHIPIITNDSVPILINIPRKNNYNLEVRNFNFKNIRNDRNLIRMTLSNCEKNKRNYIAFEAYTLMKITDVSDMPKSVSFNSYSSLNKAKKNYTSASLTCQSDHPDIKSRALKFIQTNRDEANVIEVLRRIINFTGNGIEYVGGSPQTALDTLKLGYAVCTGKANLAVALARALGIPARVILVCKTHFLVDFWIPDYGWVRADSTRAIFPVPKNYRTVIWIANIKDENYAGPIGGVVAYWGTENYSDSILFDIDYGQSVNNEEFAYIKGNTNLNNLLFEKAKKLWRLYCRLKNAGLNNEELATFSEYQSRYFKSLVDNDIQNALNFAELAISEAYGLLGS